MDIIVILIVLYAVFSTIVKKVGKFKGGEETVVRFQSLGRQFFGDAEQKPEGGQEGKPMPKAMPKPVEAVIPPEGGSMEYTPMTISPFFQAALKKNEAYRGSLGVDSHEGMDICDPSLGHGNALYRQHDDGVYGSTIEDALSQLWDERTVVQGVIMSEVLKRPSERKWRRV